MHSIVRISNVLRRLTLKCKMAENVCGNFYATQTAAVNSDSDKTVKKKKTPETKVTLIAPGDSVSIVDLVEAHKLSTRRDLKLVKIRDLDAKTKRPIYRLMTNEEYLQESKKIRTEKQDIKKSNTIKGDKLITISNKIGEHDLMTRVKNMKKLLNKQYEIRIIISNDESDNFQKAEEIYEIIEKNISMAGKLVQKRTKGNLMKFQIVPHVAKIKTKDGGTGTDGNENNQPSQSL